MYYVGILVAAGFWLLFTASAHAPYSPSMLKVAGTISIMLFGIIFLYCLVKSFDKTPGLSVGVKGLVDNSSGPISAGEIVWDQIKKIEVSTIHFQKFLTIYVRDLEPYVTCGNVLKRIAYLSNIKFTDGSINIAAGSLRMNFDDLTMLVQRYFKRYRTV